LKDASNIGENQRSNQSSSRRGPIRQEESLRGQDDLIHIDFIGDIEYHGRLKSTLW
jgi:hypothetical protein